MIVVDIQQIISIVFGLFMGMHDYILGLLHHFMKELHENRSGAYGFHTDPHWSVPFKRVRKVPACVLPVVAIVVCIAPHSQTKSLTGIEESLFWTLSAVAFLIPVVFMRLRETFFESQRCDHRKPENSQKI